MTNDPLHRFAQKVVELQERKAASSRTELDEGLLRDVALELGMSEQELIALKEQSQAHKQRAKVLRQSGNLDEAIDLLETASALNPLDVELMYLLADALFARAQRNKDEAERQRAKHLCLQVLEIAPAQKEAPGLLNAINNQDPTRQKSGAPVGLLVAGAAFVLVLLGVLSFFLMV